MLEGKGILLVDDEEGMCRMLEEVLTDSGYRVSAFTRSSEAVEAFDPARHDAVITDVKMPGLDGLEVLERVKEKDPSVPVIMITAFATVDLSIQALRKGAYDMLTKPFEPEELLYRVRNALRQTELAAENQELRQELESRGRFGELIGDSPALHAVLETARKVAARPLPVLITGESGTGKELVAQAIHKHSDRHQGRFVAINCGALPQSLLESELFGFRRGAFTGADRDRKGLLEVADGGTLFLDEVGNLPMDVQKALLRFLEEKEFYRIGEARPHRVDVRILSATNVDLDRAVETGAFREDLYYRLNVVNLHMPPLRERREDIPLLVVHFLREQSRRFGSHVKGFTPEAMELMRRYRWPGNVRQLRNVVEATLAVESEAYVTPQVVSRFIEVVPGTPEAFALEEMDYATALARFETEYLTRLLRRAGGNVEEAAARAGMNVTTIYRKMKKHAIQRDDLG
ncbi:MAG: sigma-54 dependent transcriptional regulator [Deferrisomatales bacterium]